MIRQRQGRGHGGLRHRRQDRKSACEHRRWLRLMQKSSSADIPRNGLVVYDHAIREIPLCSREGVANYVTVFGDCPD